jgi:hypothetical protein
MNSKIKKVLEEQGTQVVQAVKWIGGAIFGDADEVLDEIAERGDEPPRRHRVPPYSARPPASPASRPPRAAPPRPRGAPRDVIDVEGFTLDDDDE